MTVLALYYIVSVTAKRYSAGQQRNHMHIVVLDDFHHTYEQSAGIASLRQFAEVRVFTEPAGSREEVVERLRDSPIVIANRERTHFPADLLAALPQLELLCN